MAIVRNPGAIDFIPSENEWYKAAYYDSTLNSGSGGYWTYPTKSNTAPGNTLPDSGNNANHYNGDFLDTTNWLSPVGVFVDSPSPYGTYDQGGDVYEFNETNIDGVHRGLRGGDWDDPGYYLASSSRFYDNPDNVGADSTNGFRVASLPEPGSITLVVCGAIATLVWWRRRG
jgi:formylglycine-generating enzyme required for sulfatase activity